MDLRLSGKTAATGGTGLRVAGNPIAEGGAFLGADPEVGHAPGESGR
ncbi:hypothetical protein AB0G15_25965 [Streptosporangium sp. NPDC023825]